MERAKLLTQLSVKNGFIIAAVTIVISFVMHFIDPLMAYTNAWVSFLMLVVFIGLMVYAGTSIRKEVGGYWEFGEAFKSFLVMSLIICVTSTVYNILLMTVIDPQLPERAGAVVDKKTSEFLSKLGMSEEEIERELSKNGSGADRLRITFKNVITSFGVVLAIYGILSLILALILKKKEPFVMRTDDVS